jgi:hypothetical protein
MIEKHDLCKFTNSNKADMIVSCFAEPYIVAGCEKLTSRHGWREYQYTLDSEQHSGPAI